MFLTIYFDIAAASSESTYALPEEAAVPVFIGVLVASAVVGAWLQRAWVFLVPALPPVALIALKLFAEGGLVPEFTIGADGQVGVLIILVAILQAVCVGIGYRLKSGKVL